MASFSLNIFIILLTSKGISEALDGPTPQRSDIRSTDGAKFLGPLSSAPLKTREFRAKPNPSENYEHEVVLDKDGAYWLFWSSNKTHVIFETHVKTRGYVGFGISSANGEMYPGDVVIGWVRNNGGTTFKDCHTVGHVMPVEDESQDWVLIHGEENDFGTTLKFVRKLDTCDVNDEKITDDTMRIIYSYHPADPKSMTSLPWHGSSRRGTKSLMLLSAVSTRNIDDPLDKKSFDIAKSNFHVPAKQTSYICTTHRLPATSSKHHVIKYEPVITRGNEEHVHHIVISVFDQPIESKYDNMTYNCADSSHTPEPLRGTRSIFIAWAIGGGVYHYPRNAGIPVGTGIGSSFFLMETHYNNPTLKSDITDSSGIRISYTPTLRQYDAGLLYVEYYTDPTLFIPPHEQDLTVQAFCSQDCLNKGIPDGGVHVFGVFHHAHLLGRKMKTRHFRNGTEIEPFASDDHYDFNFQDVRSLNPHKMLLKGDSIMTECTYDSRSKTKPTYGGISTEEEMCVSTLLYYPRMSVSGCLTRPVYEDIDPSDSLDAVAILKKWNWLEPTVRQNFRNVLRQSTYQLYCGDKSLPKHHMTTMKIPIPTEVFIPSNTTVCPDS